MHKLVTLLSEVWESFPAHDKYKVSSVEVMSPVQISLEALGALVPPEEMEKAMNRQDSSAVENGHEENADIKAEINEKVRRCALSFMQEPFA